MTVKTLKNYLDAIEDDSIEVKIRLGYYRDTLDVLEATLKGTPTTILHCCGKEIITSKYEKDTLYLGNKPYMEDYVQLYNEAIIGYKGYDDIQETLRLFSKYFICLWD